MICDTTYTIIMSEISKLINMNISDWNMVSIENKIKILHNMCKNYICDKNDKKVIFSLKSLKPKKLIQYCNFSNLNNKIYYNEFKKNILDYTFEFRSKYVDKKKRVYYTYNNLSSTDYNKIITGYNNIVYNFLIKYQNHINFDFLYNALIGNNKDKLISNDINKSNDKPNKSNDKPFISINNDVITIQFNKNIVIVMKLIINSNVITNNIPMLYSITVNNNYNYNYNHDYGYEQHNSVINTANAII
jgi:hypothetical protein